MKLKKLQKKQGLLDGVSPSINQLNNEDSSIDDLENEDVSDDIIQSFDLDKSNNASENFSAEIKEEIIPSEPDAIDNIVKQNPNSTYFGYDIFLNNPEIFQSSISDYVDPDYIIGPGDEIILLLWGETELNNFFFVEKDGYLFYSKRWAGFC